MQIQQTAVNPSLFREKSGGEFRTLNGEPALKALPKLPLKKRFCVMINILIPHFHRTCVFVFKPARAG